MRRRWTKESIAAAARIYSANHGYLPRHSDWNVSRLSVAAKEEFYANDYPHSNTVLQHFGGWNAMLDTKPPYGYLGSRFTDSLPFRSWHAT